MEASRRLDWLALFLASWVAPLVYDTMRGLTYFSSLLFWLVPTLLLLPRFLHYTDAGGRRRRALALATAAIVGLGVLLDFVFGRKILQFDRTVPDQYIAWIGDVPVEEVLFYAMAPIAILLVYAWCDEYWLARYQPTAVRQSAAVDRRFWGWSLKALVIGVGLEALGLVLKHRWDPTGPVVPAYYTFLVATAFVPASLFFDVIGDWVNWRAFGVSTLYVIVTSLVWEATLALPRHWWGYQHHAMLGYFVRAWSSPSAEFPIEASLVWIFAPFACILVYEIFKRHQYRLNPDKATFVQDS